MTEENASKSGSLLTGWIVAAVVGMGLGIILTWLAVLPFLLGLYFFLLAGLLLGAIIARFGKSDSPQPKGRIWAASVTIACLVWMVTLVVEYVTFPRDAFEEVLTSLPAYVPQEDRPELREAVYHAVLSELLDRPSDGGIADWILGFPAYLSWVATDGTMRCPRILAEGTRSLVVRQGQTLWIMRVIISLLLLVFAVSALPLGLTRPPKSDDADDSDDAEKAPEADSDGPADDSVS
jgi:hypothetical protein